jgi:PPM family protein phosphatase
MVRIRPYARTAVREAADIAWKKARVKGSRVVDFLKILLALLGWERRVIRVIGFDDIEIASLTDVGIRRSHNQDAHVLMPASDAEQWRQRGHVFLVADGMGAHAVGELAAKIAVDNIPHIYSKYAQEGPLPALNRAFVEANTTIYTRGQQNREFKGMGTTGTALVLRPEGAWVGHVGDSRAYRIRAGVIEQLSFDHSLLWELARRQHKNPDELTGIPSNVIVRSLGPEPAVQVDVYGPHPLEPGDAFLLCSDGLSGQVSDREIGAVVTALPPEEACRFLVNLANLQGGPDNTTVIVVRIQGEPMPAPSASNADVFFPSAANLGSRWGLRLRRFLSQLPWAFVLIPLGIFLGAGAIWLIANGRTTAAVATFVLAGLSLLAGLVVLILQNAREARESAAEAEERPLQIYRQTACAIDEGMLQRLAHATESLQAGIREKGWEVQHAEFEKHARPAKTLREQGRLTEAFREQSRALLVLMEAVHQHRGKDESFNPFWSPPPPET